MSVSAATCALCSGPVARRLRLGRYDVARCEPCDLEFVHPTPPASEIAAVYATGYFAGTGAGYRDYFGAERDATDAKARARLARLAACGARPGQSVLDVGCADGRFLLAARAAGFRVRGVEVAPEARARLPATLADTVDASLDAAMAHGPYDVVTLWDVLEHLPDPFDALARLRAMLAPGALVGVVVPVIDNANARLWPRSWDQYKPPEHLWFFSRRALRTALARALHGEVLEEAVAWRREARVFEVARPWPGALGRLARRAESACWRLLDRAGALDPAWSDDAAMVIVRANGRTHP